jgi:hypothetical protein
MIVFDSVRATVVAFSMMSAALTLSPTLLRPGQNWSLLRIVARRFRLRAHDKEVGDYQEPVINGHYHRLDTTMGPFVGTNSPLCMKTTRTCTAVERTPEAPPG